MIEWEKVYFKDGNHAIDAVDRLKVYGGWIIRSVVMIGSQVKMSMIFIEDYEHRWELK